MADVGYTMDVGNAGVGGAGLVYNIYANERARADQQRQQAWNNDFLMNQIQYRAADMARAGLHPVLALGGMGAGSPVNASAQTPNPVGHSEMSLQASAQSAQIRNIEANTALVDEKARGESLDNAQKDWSQKEINPRTLAQMDAMLKSTVANTSWVEYQEKVIGPTVKRLNESNASAMDVEKTLKGLEVAYIRAHGGNEKMPMTNNQWNLLEHMYNTLSRTLDPLNRGNIVNSAVDSLIEGTGAILKSGKDWLIPPADLTKGRIAKRKYEQDKWSPPIGNPSDRLR